MNQAYTEDALYKVNQCFLQFGADFNENIKKIINTAAVIFNGACCLYNKEEGEFLCTWGGWNIPEDLNRQDRKYGHICFDVIKKKSDEPFVIRNLETTSYAQSDPNVSAYNLKTYIGCVVKAGGEAVGSLCVVYDADRCFTDQEIHIISILARAIGIEEERKKAEEALQDIKWLVTGVVEPKSTRQKQNIFCDQPYGDLTKLNTSGVLLNMVGKDVLIDIVGNCLDLLNTSGAVYEKNGDYAVGIFTSGWCKFLDLTSRNLCGTDDNREALRSGKWHCHESCWREASKASIETGQPVDIQCSGGIRLYAVPIWAGGEIVGSINFGYGNPPRDHRELQKIAEQYCVNMDELIEKSEAYETRPPFIIDIAKNRLLTSARLTGTIVERKKAELALEKKTHDLGKRVKELGCLYQFSWLSSQRDGSIEKMFRGMVNIISFSWQYPDITCARIIFGDKEYKTDNFKITEWKQSADIMVYGRKEGDVEVYYMEEKPLIANGPFLKEERDLINAVAERLGKIVERRKAENDLKYSERKHRTLLKNLPQKIFLKDKNSVYLYCNDNYARDLKTNCNEIAGKTDYDFFPKELAEKYREDDRGILESGGIKEIEEQYVQDGNNVVVHTVKTPIKDEQGHAAGILGIFWDITEQKKVEKEKEEMQSQLIQSEKMTSLGEIAAGIAHELNTPLNVILGYQELIKRKIDADSPCQEYVNIAIEEVEQCRQLIKDFMTYARPASSEDLLTQSFNLPEALKSSIKLLTLHKMQNVKVHLDIEEGIPSVQGDQKQIMQIFINLVNNAVQAMPNGGDVSVSVKHMKSEDPHHNGERVEFRVCDTGEGIPKESITKVFDPFFTTKRPGGGTGLGLAICQRIIETHKGTIRIESEMGKGTLVIGELPVKS